MDGEGGDQAGKEGLAELGNGVATPVVAGKGAIDPYEQLFDPSCIHTPPCLQRT